MSSSALHIKPYPGIELLNINQYIPYIPKCTTGNAKSTNILKRKWDGWGLTNLKVGHMIKGICSHELVDIDRAGIFLE